MKKIGSCGPYQNGRAFSEANTEPRLLLARASATAPATPSTRADGKAATQYQVEFSQHDTDGKSV